MGLCSAIFMGLALMAVQVSFASISTNCFTAQDFADEGPVVLVRVLSMMASQFRFDWKLE